MGNEAGRAHEAWLAAERRIEELEAAVHAYLDFLRRSLNVGPLTNNPTKEAALLRRLMELVPDAPVSRC